jgi:diguanylate cyclase (GGDEF)-like protein
VASPPTTDPYEGADLELSQRIVGILASFTAAMAGAMLAFSPPTHSSLGETGWIVAGVLIGLYAALGLWLLWPHHAVHPRRYLVAQWAGLAGIGVLVWLTGGTQSPDQVMLLLWLITGVAVHPGRRAIPYGVAVAVLAVVPLFYGSRPLFEMGLVISQLVSWLAMAVIANRWIVTIRADRLERQRGEQRASTLARVDPLTGLRNRRAFDEAAVSLVRRAQEANSPLSVVLADIDGFKSTNDRFGHLAGDKCLQEVSAAMHQPLRSYDLLYRWAGDEFVVILPGAGYAEARGVASRIREAVRGGCTDPSGVAIEVGTGVAELGVGMAVNELLTVADIALMEGKQTREIDTEITVG